MPGVPAEMKKMFEQSVLPELRKLGDGQFIVIRKLKCFGTGESQLAQMLGDMMHRARNPQVNCTVSYGVITLHIIATSSNESEAMQMADQDEFHLKNILGNLVYGTGQQTLAEAAGRLLAENKKTLSLAESCTGGLVAKMITDVPGASRYFKAGWVTYSNEAKISDLAVSPELLQNYGAVSEQVAAAMADGARRKAQTDYAVSITGIAGPEGGTEQKPVGLVYIGVASAQDCSVQRFVFSADREFIRLRSALTALNLLRLKMLI
jgi:nicotinamide-nucleotide amidase